MAHDVFISYSKKDKQVADALCAALESERIRCWLAPRDVQAGSDWASEIVKAVQGSRTMVLVFSESAAESTHVRREITTAANAGVIIVPLKIDSTDPTGAMQYYLADTHWLDAVNPPTTEQIAEVVRKVASLLEKEYDAAALVTPSQEKPKRRVPVIVTVVVAALVLALASVGVYFALRGGAQPAKGNGGSETDVTAPVSGDASSSDSTTQYPSAIPLGTADYEDLVKALPGDARSVKLEVEIDGYLPDAEYNWIDFQGTWEGHEVVGTFSFDAQWHYGASIMVERFDDMVFEGFDEWSGEAALQDPAYKHFYEVIGTSPIGAQITAAVAFPVGDVLVLPGDALTFDRSIRLVRTSW